MTRPDTPAAAEPPESDGSRNNPMEERDRDLAEPPESDGSANNRRDDAETCAAVAGETGEPCENPAILGTGLCHTHLDFAEDPVADEPDEGEDRTAYWQITTR